MNLTGRRPSPWLTLHRAAGVAAVLVVALAGSTQARVVTYGYAIIDYPGAAITFAFGLGPSANQVVGNYFDTSFERHAFLLAGGQFSTIDYPGGSDNSANSINASGQIVGQFLDSAGHYHGYLIDGASYQVIDFPGAVDTFANGINDRGQIVGDYIDLAGVDRGFLLDNGTFTTVEPPVAVGAVESFAGHISENGQIVGTYADAAGAFHGYLIAAGAFRTIDFPGADHTFLYGNNNKGDVVGRYVTNPNWLASRAQHAFLLSAGTFITVDPPGWTGRAIATDVNDRGQISGLFRDAIGRHGFVATPKAGSSN